MTLAELLAEAQRLDEAATKGPWGAVRVAKLADASGPSADNAGPASPAGGADSRGSAASSPSLGANSARTPIDCFNCAALRGTSRLLAESALYLIDRNAELTRELDGYRERERRMRGEA